MGLGTHLASNAVTYIVGAAGVSGTGAFGFLWWKKRKETAELKKNLEITDREKKVAEAELKNLQAQLDDVRKNSELRGAKIVDLESQVKAKMEEIARLSTELGQAKDKLHTAEVQLAKYESEKNINAERNSERTRKSGS